MTTTAQSLVRRLEKLRTLRATLDARWQEIATRILPHQATFTTRNHFGGPDLYADKRFDSTGAIALVRFAAALEHLLTPRTQKWHSLQPANQALKRSYRVRTYLDEVRDTLFQARYSPRTNFSGQAGKHYMSLGAFGNGVFMVEDKLGEGIGYRAIHFSECYVSENKDGQPDTVYRVYRMTARQAMQRFKEKTPAKVMQAMAKDAEAEFEWLHAVEPNEELDHGRPGPSGMPWASYHLCCDTKELVGVGGYRTFPFAVSRYLQVPGTCYGWGPAQIVLPEIRGANEQRRTIIRQGQIAVDPPVLLGDGNVMEPFQTRPGALNHGMVTPEGRPLAVPFQTGSRFDVAQEEMNISRGQIKAMFLEDLFSILLETPRMTATEVLERAAEKGALMAPQMGTQQNEFLGPCIARELDILAAAGVIPPPPGELAEAGGEVLVEYESPLSKLQRTGDASGLAKTLEVLTPILQLQPEVLDVFDVDEAARTVADVTGVPARLLRDIELVQALREQRAQAAQQQQMVEAAPMVGGAAKQLAQAGQIVEGQAA